MKKPLICSLNDFKDEIHEACGVSNIKQDGLIQRK